MPSEKQHAKEQKKLPHSRIGWGAFVLIVGFLSPLLIPVILNLQIADGLKTVISGLLAFGIPELFMIIAVAIMGKDGFNYLKKYLRLVLRVYGPPERVSKPRYILGMFMFAIPLFFALISPYFFIGKEFYLNHSMFINIGLDSMLFLSFFVLGGEFWDKLRGLFINGAVIRFPDQK